MKYIKQFGIILLITFLGEVLRRVLPLPVPASIYGLLLMLLALHTKIIKLDHVHDAAIFLVEIMPILFIPPAVGLMASWETLKPICGPVVFTTAATTVIVIAVTGLVTQLVSVSKKAKRDDRKDTI